MRERLLRVIDINMYFVYDDEIAFIKINVCVFENIMSLDFVQDQFELILVAHKYFYDSWLIYRTIGQAFDRLICLLFEQI